MNRVLQVQKITIWWLNPNIETPFDFYCMSELLFEEELLKGAARFLDEMDRTCPIKFK